MPSPKDAQKGNTKKGTATKDADLGQSLARQKSQDFNTKIAGWSVAGAEVAQDDDDDEAVLVKPLGDAEAGARAKRQDVKIRSKEKLAKGGEMDHGAETATPATPKSPKTPDTAGKVATKQVPAWKASREVDPAKKVWVRRRSKPLQDSTPDASPTPTTDVKPAIVPASKPKPSPKAEPADSAEFKDKLKSNEKPKRSPKATQDDVKETIETTTPKKRVVSDAHWRKDRTSKEDGETPTKKATKSDTNLPKDQNKDATPKPRIVRRSVVSFGMKYPPSVQEFKEEAEQRATRVRPVKRRSQSGPALDDGTHERGATPDFETSSVKIYVKKRRKSGAPDDEPKERKAFNTSESSFTVPSSVDKAGSATDITTPDLAPVKQRASRIRTEPRTKTNRPPVDDVGIRNDKSHSDAEASPRRISSNKRARNADGEKSPPTPIPKVFGNRIEGWLANMPDDPFVEPSGASERTPEPQQPPRKSSRSAENLPTKDEGDYRKTSARRRRSKVDDGFNRSREDFSAEDAPSGTIDNWLYGADQAVKRRSSKPNTYTSVKDRVAQYSARDAGVEPPRESSRRSSRRDTYAELRARPLPATGNRLSTIASVSSLQRGNDIIDRRAHAPAESVLSRASDGDEPARNTTLVRRKTKKHTDLISVLSLDRDDEYEAVRRRNTRARRHRPDAPDVADLMNEVSAEELRYQRELRTLVDGVIPVLLQYVVSQDEPTRSSSTRQTQPIVEMGVALERLKASHRRIPMHDPKELLLWAENTAKVYADYLRVWRLGFNDIVVNLAPAQKHDLLGWDQGLQKNEHGDLLDGQGERVDVAYLLKRPLVRVKNLAKIFKGISQAQRSAIASDMVDVYDELVIKAKQRSNDERARLEDEAAAAIDPSRARDVRNLIPLKGVNIDPTRRVRARDYFDMELFHSNGQQLGCRIEIIIRDDAAERSTTGDILICEVSEAGRWLLFPPVLTSNVSARKGDKDGELIAMIRGSASGGTEWRELTSLKSNDSQAAEWLEMLGSVPMPPRLSRQSSFNALRGSRALRDTAASSTDSDVPIGEQARPNAPQWDGSDVNSVLSIDETPTSPRDRILKFALPSVKESIESHGDGLDERFDPKEASKNPRHTRSRSEWIRPTQTAEHDISMSYSEEDENTHSGIEDTTDRPVRRPAVRRRTFSVPGTEVPAMNKLSNALKSDRSSKQPEDEQIGSTPLERLREPTSAPSKLQKHPLPPPPEEPADHNSASHDANTPSKSGLGAIPSFTPAFLKRHRRTSSPLKHEYEPSTASESPSISDLSDDDDEDKKSFTSDSSADEKVSTLGDLKDFSRICPPRAISRTLPSPPSPDTVGPSDSASQAPYRKVPPTDEEGVKSVANIFCWTDGGAWQSMHPEECEMVVTPGLIEAFDLSQAHAAMSKAADGSAGSPSAHGVKPLVALELTPWVPLRRGTAVDISIRGAPTSNSVLRNGSNIMFRSRNPEDCEKLYNLINRARIDNPTWIALQNARGPVPTSNWAEVMDRRNAERTNKESSSWLKTLSRKGTSYRSKGTRSASIAGTQTSAGSLHSTFSAIRQFSGSSRIFNIAKSTIMSKQSTRSSYSDSLSSGAATPLPIDPSMGTPVGITNAKTRLYLRQSTTKWKDLGNGLLTVVLPPRPDPSQPADPRTTGLEKRVIVFGKKNGTMLLDVTLGENCFERVARTGIAVSVWEEGLGPNGELGHAAATGGVISSKSTIYMLQMKSEREAAYTFSMVGKLRY